MDKLIIIPSKNFFKKYWSNYGHFGLNDENKAIKDCADILLELNRMSINPNFKTNFEVKIPKELRKDLEEKFGCIVFSNLFHDSIANVDYTVSKFDEPVADSEEAVIETAKVYNDTHQILIISDCSDFKSKVDGIDNTLQ